MLQVESLLCEVGNRQLRARDVAVHRARGERGVRGAKGKWAMRKSYQRKDLSNVAFAFAGDTRGADVHTVQVPCKCK